MTANFQTSSKDSRTFKEMSRGYLDPSALVRNKPSATERRQSTVEGNTREKLKEYFNNLPNGKTVANTWDAKHLDRFLNSSQWGLNPSAMRTQATFNHNSSSLPQARSTLRSLSTNGPEGRGHSRTSGRNSAMGESLAFKLSGRCGPEKTDIYDFSYRFPDSNINIAVTNIPVNQSSLENHYSKMFVREPAPFTTPDLEFSIKHDESPDPRARRKQLEENIKNQHSFHEWKEKNKIVTKRNRVYHNQYRSGVVSLDHPLNDSTLIYREERDRLTQEKQERSKIEERHKEDLRHYTRTSEEIQFLNKRSKLIDESPERLRAYSERPIAHGNRRARVGSEWARRVEETQDRIFGVEVKPYSVGRAEYLRNQETKGKRYNILNNGVNDVSIRQDIPRRSSSYFEHPLGKSILEKY